ncbi:two-component sensor histidine kinase [Lentzea tibetensis]|uniref:histidine kinase n=1 Tax=Lentzea tibetensis TaxID=2591470 RepID=A0A563EL58_9PSEU|nr:histidine kinase [Lentzea tibetensis]TWP47795.1 two-component sensor histidine kinase [Lentzea tibetensis]
MKWPRSVGLGLLGLAVVMTIGGSWLLFRLRPGGDLAAAFVGFATLGLAMTALGVVIAFRVRANAVGALLAWVGSIVVFLTARDVYYGSWLNDPSAVPLDPRVVAFLNESGWWLLAAVALLLLHFPDGAVPGRRWRTLPPLIVVLALAQQGFGMVPREPFTQPMEGLAHPWGPPSDAVFALGMAVNIGLIVAFLMSGVSLVLRFRRSTGVVRAQLKWLAFAGLAAMAYPVVCLAEIVVTGSSGVVALVFGVVTIIALFCSVAVAMLRHDLYDVDRVLADAVSYTVVLLVLIGAYAVSALALGLVVGDGSPAAAAGATAVCAVLLAPVRRHLQRAVDRRLFPPRKAALQAIDDLQRRVHTLGAQPEELESTLRTALRDPSLRVGLLIPRSTGFVDAEGAPVADTGLVPITLGGTQIGVLASSVTTPAVLRVVASAAASLVEVSRLRAELANALREVEASRTRLVQVGDAERRRLERDLHDGAQQRLVSLGMAMRLAQRQLPTGSVDVHAVLDQGVAELATAIAELRQIAHGLRPTSLDDGLHSALSALTNKLPVPVRLEIMSEPLADNIATTAYFVAAEAITNAAKHANASAITVRVTQEADEVSVCVQDDGCGGADPRAGSGLSGLADRVAALGGSLLLNSRQGVGTTIQAVLPCES